MQKLEANMRFQHLFKSMLRELHLHAQAADLEFACYANAHHRGQGLPALDVQKLDEEIKTVRQITKELNALFEQITGGGERCSIR